MKKSRMIGSSVRAMSRNKLRTFFMMLGTLIGVTALTVTMALGQGTQRALLESIERLFSGHTILLNAGSGMRGGGPHGTGVTTTLTVDDIAAIEAAVPAIEMSDPMQSAGTREVVFEGNATEASVLGHSNNADVVWNRGVSRGSYLTADDIRSSARVALVGETVVRDLFGDVDPIGQQIRIGTVPFEVVGVLDRFGIDPHGLDKDNEVIVPYSTVLRRLRNLDYISSAKLLVDAEADLDITVLAIQAVLRDRHGLAPGEPNDFSMITPKQVTAMVESTNQVFTVLLPIVAVVSIIVGGVVVANLMLLSVNERRQEIGLRKAMGARTRDVWWQFVLEATAITTAGGALAIVIGVGVLRLITHLTQAEIVFPWEVTLVGMGVAVLVGLVAGAMPAGRAARMDPIESLR